MRSFAIGAGANATPGASDGLYRTLRAEATVSNNSVIMIPANDAGSVGHGGDSGGPDFVMNWGGVYLGIVSVQSSCVPSGYVAGRARTWEWVTGILSCDSAPIGALRDEILEIIREVPPAPSSRVLVGTQDRVTTAPAPSRVTASAGLGVARDRGAFTPSVGDLTQQNSTSDEIVLANRSGQLHYWTLFQGARYSGADLTGAARVPPGMQKTFIGDMNGDGEDDIIYWAQTGQISFAPVLRGVVASERINVSGLLPRSSGWDLLAAGDVNGDGTDDLIFRHDGDYKIHYWRIRDGVREDGIDVGGAGRTPDGFLGAGDLNGDETDDLIWLVDFIDPTSAGELPNMQRRVRYWPMRNGGRLGTIELGEPPVELRPEGDDVTLVLGSEYAGVGDIYGDGVDDILWRRTDGQIHYWAIRNE